MDAFERYWQWAEKPIDSTLTIPAELHSAITALPEHDRHDRSKVNNAVRDTLVVELRRWQLPEDIDRLNDKLHALADAIAWRRPF
jgi:hypothetical protein